jgi:DNA repair exonuclease SbcCD ATPase subunit
MTNDRPTLFLKRLVVRTHINTIAYDQEFHNGVNIIRGKNSSGKSTIANFIFYALGGAYNNWTAEALKCKVVIAEIKVNGAIITIKRNISESPIEPMSIYWNNYEESNNDSLNWQTYTYKQSPNIISFTNVLFNALSFPEVKSDSDSNITMHQLLRLLYIDQDTPTQSLFRFERFDPPLTREAISEILLGIYDDSLYTQRLNLKQSVKDSDEKKREFDNLNRVFGQTGNVTNIAGVQREIENAKEELNGIEKAIIELRIQHSVRTTKKTELNSEKVQTELTGVKNYIRNIQAHINQFDIEISDSRQFISTLEKRISDLNNSLLTRQVLGELPLTHCPQCLSPLDNHITEGHCFLCKQPLSEESEKANAKRLMQEMELQVKESKGLLEEKERKYTAYISELPPLIETARNLQKQLDISIDNPQSTRDERIDNLLVTKGGVEKKIEYLTQQIKAVELIELLKNELAQLAAYISNMRSEIYQKEELQKRNYQISMQKIRDLTLYILRNDLDRQEEFRSGRNVQIDFLRDTFSLDDGNNFSASSKTYFKNAVLFSIFFASVELGFFRYPRFILCDNMEDKGMEKERTQNFQDLITSMSDLYEQEHQIIFTTSMVSDNLNNKPYCVGQEYDRFNKTLNI